MLNSLLTLEATTGEGQAQGGNWIVLILIYGAFIFLLYFFMFRPQKKQQKALRELISQLEIGDVVLTSSGFYGTIIEADMVGHEKTVIVPGTEE